MEKRDPNIHFYSDAINKMWKYFTELLINDQFVKCRKSMKYNVNCVQPYMETQIMKLKDIYVLHNSKFQHTSPLANHHAESMDYISGL